MAIVVRLQVIYFWYSEWRSTCTVILYNLHLVIIVRCSMIFAMMTTSELSHHGEIYNFYFAGVKYSLLFQLEILIFHNQLCNRMFCTIFGVFYISNFIVQSLILFCKNRFLRAMPHNEKFILSQNINDVIFIEDLSLWH